MHFFKYLAAAATVILPDACAVPIPVRSYSSADGSSEARYGIKCLYPMPLSSTVIFHRSDIHVQLDIYGVYGDTNTLSAAILVQPQAGVTAGLLEPDVQIDALDFNEPLVATTRVQWARPETTERLYAFSVSMPATPNELSMKFPAFVIQGEVVALRNLVLRSEKRLQLTGLCQ